MDSDSRPLTVPDMCDGLADAGVKLVASLPDNWLVPLIAAVNRDDRFQHVPVTREESGIAACAGAFCAGSQGAVIMGTSGFMTCVYAITKICMSYELGMPIITNLRGEVGDGSSHHYGNALHAREILEELKIPVVRLRESADKARVAEAVHHARLIKRPVALVVDRMPISYEG
jgi:sulfopyruvate decarboxylase subunit alpha